MSGRLRAWLVEQFGRPTGFWGRMAGHVMARRPSNRRRNAWTVELAGLEPGARVLEIGFGPGLALAHTVAAVGPTGRIAGIDHSPVMLEQARRRNQQAVAAGIMDLRVGQVQAIPDFGYQFDAILAINTVGFWPEVSVRLRELRDRLAPGGRLAVTVQPRSKGATAETSRRSRQDLECALEEAGFADIAGHMLDLDPPAVCVIGRKY